MWKDSFTSRLRIFLALFMLLIIVEAGLIISTANSSSNIIQLTNDIQNLVYIFLFLIFLFTVMLFFYIPLLLHRKLKEIHYLLREITEGNYHPEIDLKKFDQDKEFLEFVVAIRKMLQVVVKFDQLKAEKITEHNNRILGLLNLASNGFMIIAESGDVIYANDLIKNNYVEFKANQNFFDDIFSSDIETSIKPYVIEILRSGSKGKDLVIHSEIKNLEISVKSYIVRDEAGEPMGTVVALYGLPEIHEKAKEKPRNQM